MRKTIFWDILFWMAMIILILYIIGKLTGIINTPEWVDLIPLITLVFIMGAFYQKVRSFMEVMDNRTNYLKNKLENISNNFIEQDKRISFLENKRK